MARKNKACSMTSSPVKDTALSRPELGFKSRSKQIKSGIIYKAMFCALPNRCRNASSPIYFSAQLLGGRPRLGTCINDLRAEIPPSSAVTNPRMAV